MSHPYTQFENTKLWKVLDEAVADLKKNQDLKIETAREYVVGYLCRELIHGGLVSKEAIEG